MDFKAEAQEFIKARVQELQDFRRDSGIEKVWRQADRFMDLTHTDAQNKFARDFTSRKVSLKTDDWQSDNSDLTPWQKVHIALSALAEQNPKAVFKARRKEFEPNELFRGKVYAHSLNEEMFRYKLKRFIYNQGKYGVAFATTRLKIVDSPARDLKSVSEDEKEEYNETTLHRFKGPWFRPLSNWRVYWDDAAEVFDPLSMRDWMFYDWFTKDQVKALFPKADHTKVSPESPADTDGKEKKRKDLVKLYFYENYEKDLSVVSTGNYVLDAFPLPTADHRLSLNYAPWMIRDESQVPGCGIPEILSQEKNLLDKIRNMSVDQVVLSIYKTFFYDGTNQEDGTLIVAPGRGQQVLDPSKVRWLEVPGAGPEAYKREEQVRNQMDSLTFSKTLGGETVAGKTAYEVEAVKNASARRLSSPLDGLRYALHSDAQLRMGIIKGVIQNSEVEEFIDPTEQDAIRAVYKQYPSIFHWSDDKKTLYRYKYPEVRLPLERTDEGLKESDKDNFFLLTPEGERFEGDCEMEIKSFVAETPELEKRQLLELNNLLIPLFGGDPAINKKPAMKLLKQYGQDPNDWLPDSWLGPNPQAALPPAPPGGGGPPAQDNRARPAPTVVPPNRLGQAAKSVVGKLGRMFTKVNPKTP